MTAHDDASVVDIPPAPRRTEASIREEIAAAIEATIDDYDYTSGTRPALIDAAMIARVGRKPHAFEPTVDRTYCARCDTWHAWKHQDNPR